MKGILAYSLLVKVFSGCVPVQCVETTLEKANWRYYLPLKSSRRDVNFHQLEPPKTSHSCLNAWYFQSCVFWVNASRFGFVKPQLFFHLKGDGTRTRQSRSLPRQGLEGRKVLHDYWMRKICVCIICILNIYANTYIYDKVYIYIYLQKYTNFVEILDIDNILYNICIYTYFGGESLYFANLI